MKLFHPVANNKLWLSLLLVALVFLVACSAGGDEGASNDNTTNSNEMDNATDDDHEDDDEHEHEDGEAPPAAEDRIANNGASIRILAPEDGAVFSAGDEVVVEVEVEDFDLEAEGSHWHVYVDGASWGMIMGGDTDQALRGLEAGEHQIEVYLAGGDHIELEDGDTIAITIE